MIEFDLFGLEASYYPLDLRVDMPNDAMRIRHIRTLIEHGHLDRIVISHDICYRTRPTRFGGHGYGHIFRNVLPMMRRREFDENEIDAIMTANPRRLLTFVRGLAGVAERPANAARGRCGVPVSRHRQWAELSCTGVLATHRR